MPGLPEGDGKPLAATLYPAENSECHSGFMAFLQREAGLVIYGYVILENHLHLIAKPENLSRDIRRFKSFTAQEIIAYQTRSWSFTDRIPKPELGNQQDSYSHSPYAAQRNTGASHAHPRIPLHCVQATLA